MKPLAKSPITAFFLAHEEAIQPDSNADLGAYYDQSFLFGGPHGAQPVKLEDFIRVVPKMSAEARSKGLISTRLKSLETIPLDGKYTIARVVWDITVAPPGAPVRHLDTSATYTLMATGAGHRIISQIDHQDLSGMI